MGLTITVTFSPEEAEDIRRFMRAHGISKYTEAVRLVLLHLASPPLIVTPAPDSYTATQGFVPATDRRSSVAPGG